MPKSLSAGSIHVADNSVVAINDAIRQLQAQIDTLRGLSGTVNLYSPINIVDTTNNSFITINPSSGITASNAVVLNGIFPIRNETGLAIAKGAPLYPVGASNGVMLVGLADADTSAKMPAVGLCLDILPDLSDGQAIAFGNLDGLDTSSWSVGTKLYVSTTAGSLTSTAPSATTEFPQRVGTVLISDVATGRILVELFGTDTQGTGSAPHNLLDGSVDQDTTASSVTAGDLIYGNSTPAWDDLPIGTDGQVLTVSSGLPSWADPTGGNSGSGVKWDPDLPPTTPGASDDEFRDVSGGVPTGWTEVDHGSTITVDEDSIGLELNYNSATTGTNAGIYKTIPAGDFTIWAKCSMTGLAATDQAAAGLALWEDATNSAGDLITLYNHVKNTQDGVYLFSWTAYDTFSATLASEVSGSVAYTTFYLRIRRTGTTYAFDYSCDGICWVRLYSNTISFTPTHFGPIVYNNTSNSYSARFQFFRYVNSDIGLNGISQGNIGPSGTAQFLTDVANVDGHGASQMFEHIIAGSNITVTELANGAAIKISGSASSSVGMYSPDATPASAGTDDDEFADNSGGVPSGWTEYDHGTLVTVSENKPGVVITETSGGSAWGGIYKAVQSGDWTIWTKFSISRIIQTQFRQAALAIFEDATSSTGDLVVWQVFTNNTGITSLRLDVYSAYNTYSSTLAGAFTVGGTNEAEGFYLRARRTGTTYAFDFSHNGIGWQRAYSGTIPFTAAQYGLVFLNTAATDARATFQFFRFVGSDVGLNGEVYGNRF